MDIPLSRQPIFDAAERVAGYRISHAALRDDEDTPAGHAAHRLLVNAFLGIGIRRLAGDRPAFIAAGASLLRSGSLELLDPATLYVELTGPDALSPAALQTVARLRGDGHRFVADVSAHHDPAGLPPHVLAHADIVRLDVGRASPARLAELATAAHTHGVALLADNVPGRTERDRLAALGFSLFQGFGFSRPEVITSRELGVQHLRMLELLRRIRSLDANDAQIAAAFRADVSLSYKLLRMVNSAAFGVSGLRSIEHALRLLGRETLYRWLLLLFLSSGPTRGASGELLQTALVRARLCESLADLTGRTAERSTLYTIGLLSLLDLLLGLAMDEIIEHIGFSEEIRSALIERTGYHGGVLRIVEAYDLGMWTDFDSACTATGVPAADVPTLYLEALNWAARHAPPPAAPTAAPARRSAVRQQAAQTQL